MKKIVIVTSLLLSVCVFQAAAQTDKGDWMVGGGFGFNTAKRNTEINFSPSAGAFVINNLAVGGNLLIDYNKLGATKTTSFGIGPFVRYYFRQDNNNVAPILHTSFNFLSAKTTASGFDDIKTNGINFFFGGGAAFFLSQNVSIDALAGYDYSKFKDAESSSGFKLSVGFQVYLTKRQINSIKKN